METDARDNGAQQSESLPWLGRFHEGAPPASPCAPTGGRLRVVRFNLHSDHTDAPTFASSPRRGSKTPLGPVPPELRNLTVRRIPGVDPDSRTPSGGPFFRGRNCIRMASELAIRNSRQPGQATGGTPPKPDAEAFSRCRVSSPQRPTPRTDAENLTVRRITGAVPLNHEPLPSKTCKIAIPLPETDLGGNWGPLDL